MTGRCGCGCVVLLLLLATNLARAADPAPAGWKAGAAKVKITPEKPMWMSGYSSRTKPAEGTLHDLWAKALFLEGPHGKQAVLVTLDLVGIDRQLSQAISADLTKTQRLPREAITLSVSHTHTGPVVHDNLNTMYQLGDDQQQLVRAYADMLHQRVVEVVAAARKDLKPASLEWGIGSAAFAVNRRNNKEKDVPQLIEKGELKGPVDHEVPVLAVRSASGELRAVVFGYACHATVLDFYKWSGDYPGFAQSRWRRRILGLWPCSGPAAAATKTRCRGAASPWPKSMALCLPAVSRPC